MFGAYSVEVRYALSARLCAKDYQERALPDGRSDGSSRGEEAGRGGDLISLNSYLVGDDLVD